MLYEEDHFHPSNSDVNIKDIKTNNINNKTDIIQNIRSLDSGFIVKTIKVIKQNKEGKREKHIKQIQMYGTGETGSNIRNAISGQRMPHLVGSKNEDLYFSVMEVTGINGRNEGIKLFYDSPEQYEKHFYVTLDQQIKERWHNKFINANK
jgi:hypothetical protein